MMTTSCSACAPADRREEEFRSLRTACREVPGIPTVRIPAADPDLPAKATGPEADTVRTDIGADLPLTARAEAEVRAQETAAVTEPAAIPQVPDAIRHGRPAVPHRPATDGKREITAITAGKRKREEYG